MFTTAPLTDFYVTGSERPCTQPNAFELLKAEPSFAVLYRAIERCVAEGLFAVRADYGVFEMALTAWSHVHGAAMLRVTTFRHLPIDWQAIDQGGLDVLFFGFQGIAASA